MESTDIRVHFLGAAGTVTGSKYLVETDNHRILVDCGLFQGLKKLRLLNWSGLPFPVEDLDIVLLTHGHLDHSGYLGRLVRMGYRNDILGTAPTLDIASIILRDSGKIQEETADKANKGDYSIHRPAEPLYTVKDAERCMERFRPKPEGEWIPLFDNISARFQYVGHILGATFIELDIHGKRLVFSGDIGRKNDLLLRDAKKPERADVLFLETTYGDRLRSDENPRDTLRTVIQKTLQRKGTVIIPCFAVERAQTLMYLLWQLKASGEIDEVPMVLDSPMGENVLEVFENHKEWHNLSTEEYKRMCDSFWIVQDIKETKIIVPSKEPKIVIAGSGMLSGGRVLDYLEYTLSDPTTSIILTGFQAEGTRGRALLSGAESLKIYGKHHTIRAEVYNLEMLSSHADQSELLDWMGDLETAPERIFLTHGEAHAADAFRVKIRETFGWNAEIPELYSITEV